MPTQNVGLYIGKFQPFHNGHLAAIKYIVSQADDLIIAIGSSQYQGLQDQPFSALQRRQMILRTLSQEDLRVRSIVAVPDIHDNDHWVAHVQRHVPSFDTVFTNNPLVKQLFAAQKIRVEPIPMLPGVSGTLIRQCIATDDAKWKLLVSPTTVDIIEAHVRAHRQ